MYSIYTIIFANEVVFIICNLYEVRSKALLTIIGYANWLEFSILGFQFKYFDFLKNLNFKSIGLYFGLIGVARMGSILLTKQPKVKFVGLYALLGTIFGFCIVSYIKGTGVEDFGPKIVEILDDLKIFGIWMVLYNTLVDKMNSILRVQMAMASEVGGSSGANPLNLNLTVSKIEDPATYDPGPAPKSAHPKLHPSSPINKHSANYDEQTKEIYKIRRHTKGFGAYLLFTKFYSSFFFLQAYSSQAWTDDIVTVGNLTLCYCGGYGIYMIAKRAFQEGTFTKKWDFILYGIESGFFCQVGGGFLTVVSIF
jgi:hypothetical protein